MNKLARQIMCFLLIAVFMLQITNKFIVIVRFEMNRDFIAKNLCEKKAKRNNCCKGSCHLKKELAKEEKKEQSPINFPKEKTEVQFFSEISYNVSTSIVPFISNSSTNYSFSFSEKHILSVFHPPTA